MTGNRVRYSKEQKEAIVKRMMPPSNEAVKQIAKEEGITEVTLYKWRKEARAAGEATGANLYALQDLHTKLYIFDKHSVITGSANFTFKGFFKMSDMNNFTSVA